MARTRTIKPDFFRSRSLARVSIPARLTFIGLWCEADDNGNGVADPDILKGSLWPKTDVSPADVEGHLRELAEEHIALYTVDGERYYHIVNWEQHQSAAYRRGEPKYPGPDDGEPWLHTDECKNVQVARGGVQAAHQGVLLRKGREGSGVEAAAVQRARLAPNERTALIRAAARIIVNRRNDPRLENPAYLSAAVNGVVSDHQDEAHRLLTENPNLTAEQLAEALVPVATNKKLPICSDCRAAYTGHGCQIGPSYLECPMVGPLAGEPA